MKRIILLFIITLTSLTISAKEVVKNPATGKSLDNTMGIYSIKGNSGILTLGTEDQARHFMIAAANCFVETMVGYYASINDQEYKVAKDEAGLYIFREDLEMMKIRSHDVIVFGTALGCKKLFKETKEGFKYINENWESIWETLHE